MSKKEEKLIDLNFPLKDRDGNEIMISKDKALKASDVVASLLDNPTEGTAGDVLTLVRRNDMVESLRSGDKIEIVSNDEDDIKILLMTSNLKINSQLEILKAMNLA